MSNIEISDDANVAKKYYSSNSNSYKTHIGIDGLRISWTLNSETAVNISQLTQSEEVYDVETGVSKRLQGNLKNLRVRVYQTRVVIENSPATFMYGDNICPLQFSMLTAFLEEVGRQLNLDPKNAQLLSIDITANLPLFLNPAEYFQYSAQKGRYILNATQRNTIYFQTKTRSRVLALYNKSEEARISGNLLRLELRIKRRIKEKFKKVRGSMQPILASEINTVEFQTLLLEEWSDYFCDFLLEEVNRLELNDISSSKGLKEYALQLLQADRAHSNKILAHLVARQKLKPISAKPYWELRKLLRQIPEGNDLRKELTEAIQDAKAKGLLDIFMDTLFPK